MGSGFPEGGGLNFVSFKDKVYFLDLVFKNDQSPYFKIKTTRVDDMDDF